MYMPVTNVAKILSIDKSTVSRWANKFKISYITRKRKKLISVRELLNKLAEQNIIPFKQIEEKEDFYVR